MHQQSELVINAELRIFACRDMDRAVEQPQAVPVSKPQSAIISMHERPLISCRVLRQPSNIFHAITMSEL
jgi:hypothetical protein